MKRFDIIVIGSGSANIVVDEALEKGLKCAMIENGKFGGTCLTRGCIPTKVMVTVADFIRQAQKASKIGINIKDISVDFDKVSKRVWQKIDESKDVYQYYKSKENLTVYEGTAKFISDKEIKVVFNDSAKQDEIITADKIVIGAGARTKVPKIEGLEEVGYLTSESFFGDKFPKKPYESVTVIGGGYIGVEFAHILSALGSKVNIVQHNMYLLPKEEEDVSVAIPEILSKYGIDVYTNKDTIRTYMQDGKKVLEFKNISNGRLYSVKSDEIIVAPGVMSNADTLDIQNTSIELEKGYIKTNEFLETTVDGVYAIGDINGKYQFRHKANYEAEILSHNLFYAEDNDYEFVSYDAVPAVTYIYPQVAHVGLTEKEARKKGYKIQVAMHYYYQTAKGFALGYDEGEESDGFVKIIIEKDSKKILGVHIIGDEASILLQPYVELMNAGEKIIQPINEEIGSQLTKRLRKENYKRNLNPNTIELTNKTMVAHPSLSEVSIWTKYMDFK